MSTLEKLYIDAIKTYNEQLTKHGRTPIKEDELPTYLIKHSLKRLMTWMETANHDLVYHAKLCVMATRGCAWPIWTRDGKLGGILITESHGKTLCRSIPPDKRPHFSVFFDKFVDGCHMCYYVLPYGGSEWISIRKGVNYSSDRVYRHKTASVNYDGSIDRMVFDWLKESFGKTPDDTARKVRTILTKYMKLMVMADFVSHDVLTKYGSVDQLIDMCVKRIIDAKILALAEMTQLID